MRWGLFIVLALAPAIGLAGPTQSNPAFLGVGDFRDVPGGCEIGSVTRMGAAADANIEIRDVVTALDFVPLLNAPCQQLVDTIVAHQPGDRVRVDVQRGVRTIVTMATLTTRAEVLQRRVGARIESTALIDVDDPRHTYDLSDGHGRTTIVGWFDADCLDCAKVFDRIRDGIARRIHDAPPQVLAVVRFEPHDPLADPRTALARLRKTFTSTVALAAIDPGTFESIAMRELDRIFFMVIDGRGTVQFVAPLAPDADDLAAAVDEVLAAAEQAEHARTSRR